MVWWNEKTYWNGRGRRRVRRLRWRSEEERALVVGVASVSAGEVVVIVGGGMVGAASDNMVE